MSTEKEIVERALRHEAEGAYEAIWHAAECKAVDSVDDRVDRTRRALAYYDAVNQALDNATCRLESEP